MVPLKRPTLCIVAGPNGSGKTTTTIQLLANEWAEDSLYINPDQGRDLCAIEHQVNLFLYCFRLFSLEVWRKSRNFASQNNYYYNIAT